MAERAKGRHFKDEGRKSGSRQRRAGIPSSARTGIQDSGLDESRPTESIAVHDVSDDSDAGLDRMATDVDSTPEAGSVDPFDLMPDIGDSQVWETGAAEPAPEPKKRHPIRRAIVVLLAAALCAVAAAGYAFSRSVSAVATAARSAAAISADFMSSLQQGNTSVLASDAEAYARYVAVMQGETDTPLWQAVSWVPVAGGDAARMTALVDAMQELSDGVLTPAAQSLGEVSLGSLFEDRSIDAEALVSVCDALSDAKPAIESAYQSVDGLGTADDATLEEALGAARTKLSQLDAAATKAQALSVHLSAMLGTEGARRYLLVVEDSSKIRPVGGSPAAAMVVTVDGGKISLGAVQAGDGTQEVDLAFTDEERQVVDGLMGCATDDAFVLPSFPRAAQLLAGAWESAQGEQVDGVIAIDASFLQSLLGLTGGVTASDGTKIDGTNAAQILLSQASGQTGEEGDARFAQTASLMLDSILGNLGQVSLQSMEHVLADGVHQGRFLIYLPDEGEEEAIAALGAAGGTSQDAEHPVTGFYAAQAAGSESGSQVAISGSVGEASLGADGTVSYEVTVSVENAAEGSTAELGFCAMAPAGGTIESLSVDGAAAASQDAAELYGNEVWAGKASIAPSSSAVFTYTVTVAAGAQEGLSVWTTPAVQPA